ncbi:peptidoglycan DD-metalloendopeptidase family protein [Streptomyces celluloflavus]|uniref:peptidoglycan DD-metalloendopeptidase family protein n=1 Tax=Streptomyces celluloflavus TaxID=58344 RepID=UPI003799C868
MRRDLRRNLQRHLRHLWHLRRDSGADPALHPRALCAVRDRPGITALVCAMPAARARHASPGETTSRVSAASRAVSAASAASIASATTASSRSPSPPGGRLRGWWQRRPKPRPPFPAWPPPPSLPLPDRTPPRYGPSCFFPARMVRAPAAVAMAATAFLTGLVPVLGAATALALTAPPAAASAHLPGHAPERDTGRDTGRITGGVQGHVAEGAEAPTADRSWPVDGPAGLPPTVLRGWEPPPSPYVAGHRGVDVAASVGAPVRAAAPGTVTFAGTVAGQGVLTIELSRSGSPPLRTTYEPVSPTARKGDLVVAGQPVAVLQRGPFHCRGPCLHWGLLRGETYLDPLSLLPPSLLRAGPSRLLPVIGIPEPPGLTSPAGPALAAHQSPTIATPTALVGAAALAAAALWALGRLSPVRPARPVRRCGSGRFRDVRTLRRGCRLYGFRRPRRFRPLGGRWHMPP